VTPYPFLLYASLCGLLLSACGDRQLPSGSATTAAPLTAHKAPAVPAAPELLINQLGFSSASNKSALVRWAMGSTANTADSTIKGRFALLENGKEVFHGDLLALPAFTEWNQLGGVTPTTGYFHYWSADFSRWQQAGEFQLAITLADQTAVSAPFQIGAQLEFKRSAEALLNYFTANRYLDERDKSIRIFASERRVNVWGGWMDAGGDTGKYLSHLSYANFMNPQQGALVTWALAKSYRHMPADYRSLKLETRLWDETFWGADYLHRILDPEGYFYLTVFDGWGSGPERMVTGYVGLEGEYTKNYQAAFREGAGMAIAALASAAALSQQSQQQGEFSGAQYLADAERAFAYLQQHNRRYCDDGRENMIDDYTALIAANELYRTTHKSQYLEAARTRAANLNRRMTDAGWFISDGDLGQGEPLGERPFYHGVEAGLPLIALVDYSQLEPDATRRQAAQQTLGKALQYQLQLNREASNPFDYARQSFTPYKNGQYSAMTSGFFMPHANETLYWWQGESARLASLTAASIWAGKLVQPQADAAFGVTPALGQFAQHQLDWILGRNPYNICHLYGFGVHNPPAAESGGSMVKGGISNGITGATASDEGRGITWAEGPDENDWRWVEQWIPHSTWYLLAITAMNEQPTNNNRD
jgi:hypothetical protein